MSEHRIQHLTEMPKTCWNIVSNNTRCINTNRNILSDDSYATSGYTLNITRGAIS
ncbi:hypothetical protein MTR_4g052870 [Medicago truncatula]|uniref:Uncharacterized protein n=1 Tax=Medicago truncatula TaxID=3880 RepID=A0A072UJM6_MEDTR|nr:hypothetical protein MTR_4g052870 [Medicago truncatula]